ncbi:MAG: hypothetical protein ABSC94_07640 [Polyangiaceae bacterium]
MSSAKGAAARCVRLHKSTATIGCLTARIKLSKIPTCGGGIPPHHLYYLDHPLWAKSVIAR